jgi:hypothetical protein
MDPKETEYAEVDFFKWFRIETSNLFLLTS